MNTYPNSGVGVKMPIINRKAWCQQCRTLADRDFVPVVGGKAIELVWNYYTRCSTCEAPIFAAYVDDEWWTGMAKMAKVSLDITCDSCHETAIFDYTGKRSGIIHPRFYLPQRYDHSSVYMICPNTNEPIIKPTISLVFIISPLLWKYRFNSEYQNQEDGHAFFVREYDITW